VVRLPHRLGTPPLTLFAHVILTRQVLEGASNKCGLNPAGASSDPFYVSRPIALRFAEAHVPARLIMR